MSLEEIEGYNLLMTKERTVSTRSYEHPAIEEEIIMSMAHAISHEINERLRTLYIPLDVVMFTTSYEKTDKYLHSLVVNVYVEDARESQQEQIQKSITNLVFESMGKQV